VERAEMTTTGLVLLGVVGLVVAGAVAIGLVLTVRRSARVRTERELWPAPNVSVPPQGNAHPRTSGPGGFPPAASDPPAPEPAPPSVAPAPEPPPPGAAPASPAPGLVLVSQPEIPGGWSHVFREHAARQQAAADATLTPDGVDELDPAVLAEAAAGETEGGVKEDQTEQTENEEEQAGALSPLRDASSELVLASTPDPSRLRLLGLVLGLLTERTRQEQPPQLGTALARLGDGDQDRARAQLSTLSLTLMGEDQLNEHGEQQLSEFLSDVLGGEMANGFGFSTMPEFQQALNAVTPELRHRLDTVVWSRNADAINILTPDDVEVLERVAVAMTAALILDTTYGGRLTDDDGETEARGEGEAKSDAQSDSRSE
jgi:hypothetical protein